MNRVLLRFAPLIGLVGLLGGLSLCASDRPPASVRTSATTAPEVFSKTPRLGASRAPGPTLIPPRASWGELPTIALAAPFRLFWGIYGAENAANREEARRHGFEIAVSTQTLTDYPGKQKENIARYVKDHPTPWDKPPYFERIVRRNIRDTDTANAGLLYQDIELFFHRTPKSDAPSRAAISPVRSQRYVSALASWYTKPLDWAHESHPSVPVGVYGVQPFARDYWGFVRARTRYDLLLRHSGDLPLWQAVEPHVDYAVASVYVFHDDPSAQYYIAANVEENAAVEGSLKAKPLYAFVWFRYHPGAGVRDDREVSVEIAEADAVLPFFEGAHGIVVWGYEPHEQGPYFESLRPFLSMLSRFARLTPKLSDAHLRLVGGSAFDLWHSRSPIIREFVRPNGECVVLAIDPWQPNGKSRSLPVECGGRRYLVEVTGAHPSIADVGPALSVGQSVDRPVK